MFYSLALLSELCEGYRRASVVNGVAVLLIETEGQRYIIEDKCPHMDAKLNTGKIIASDIVCRAHGIHFCLKTGRAQGPLADTLDCLKRFPIVYDGNKIGLDL